MMLTMCFFLDFFTNKYIVDINCLDKFIGICCGYSFKLPLLVEAIQMSTNNIYNVYNKEV